MPKDYRIRSFLSMRHAHSDLCKHLGIDSSTDLDDPIRRIHLHCTSVNLLECLWIVTKVIIFFFIEMKIVI